jgi:MFS transporter, FHS family, glucose/mannose:H+ symporter
MIKDITGPPYKPAGNFRKMYKKMQRKKIFLAYLKEIPNFMSIFLYPIFLISISPILLDISKELNIDIKKLNIVISFIIIGNIAGQLTSPFFNAKFSRFKIIIFSYIMLIPVTVSLFFVSELFMFYAVYLLLGYFLGTIWIQSNGFLLESEIENKNRLINIALVFFPIGALIAPLLSIFVSALGLNWRYLYAIILLIIVCIMLSYIIMKRKSSVKKTSWDENFHFKDIFTNKKHNLIFIISSLSLFFYGIAEAIIFSWSPSFFRIDKGLTAQLAGLSITILWIAIMVGRILVGIILCRIKPYILALLLSVLSIVSLFFMIFLSRGYMILVTIFFVGLGYSGIFSLVFSTSCLIYEQGRDILETILFVLTNLGASLAPFIVGAALQLNLKFSMSTAMIFMSLVLVLLIINIVNYKKFIRNQNVC